MRWIVPVVDRTLRDVQDALVQIETWRTQVANGQTPTVTELKGCLLYTSFYLSGWDAPQNGLYANFEARDILEFMNGIFMKGVYRPSGISLKALAEEVLLDAGLPEREDGLPPWKLHESLDDMYTCLLYTSRCV